MRRARVALGCLLLVAGACTSSSEDTEVVFRRYVRAWPAGGSALAATITGADSQRLVDALRGLSESEVIRADVVRVSRASGDSDSLQGVVDLHFADEGRLELTARATIERGRVLAEPAAISTLLTDWESLRIEEFASPARGAILSRSDTVLARGPEGRRVIARPALAPAVALVDDNLDLQLTGRPGRRLVAGTPARVLAEAPPADGEDVVTSLDDGVQAAAEKTLGRVPGALVAVDPRTGGVRALVSTPTREAPDRSPANSAYSPGSTFKVVTAAAALEGGIYEPTAVVPCPAQTMMGERLITNFRGIDYGQITFEKAFAVSCNTAFAQIGASVGTAQLLQTAQALGFRVGELSGPGTIAVPTSLGELAVWSFGAAGSLVSPLEMAGIGATIARGGSAVRPGWTDRTAVGNRAISEGTAATLVALMEEVVESGTGRRAAVPGARVAGKTGTADPESGVGSDAWFLGLIPAPEPRLVAVVFLPEGGVGGDLAASMVQKFFLETSDEWAH